MATAVSKDDVAPEYQDSGDESVNGSDQLEPTIRSISDRLQEANIKAGVKPYNGDLEKFTDLGLKDCKVKGFLSTNGPPDICFAIKCLCDDHEVTKELNKGFF